MTHASTHDIALADFRRRNRLFAAIATAAIAVIAGIMALTLLVVITRWDALADQTLRRLALTWAPTPFYLWALWSLRGMFGAFARAGLSFQPALAGALVRIGWGLLLGALTTLVASPFVLAMRAPRGMTGGFATFNVPAFTLGIVGLALIATARILRHGARIEAEAASLRAELEEFV